MTFEHPRPGLRVHAVAGALGLWALAGTAIAAEPPATALTELSLEDLLKVEITSAARKAQKLYDTAAAVYVITHEDIQRSGATSIPEALRLAPGVQVGRFGPNKWAVTARGDNGRFANKLLVLLDGRSIYTPLFAGVLWEANDVVLENIERIEVIRGPGAALWGANAVNGVINIITRHAADTQGTQLTARAGSIDRYGTTARHGGRIGDDGHYRIYAKAFEVAPGTDLSGASLLEPMRGLRAGFRSDLAAGGGRLMLSGEVHGERVGDLLNTPALVPPYVAQSTATQRTNGFHLLGRWSATAADGSSLTVQGYAEHSEVDFPSLLAESRDTIDFELQRRLARSGRHDVQWGVGLRVSRDRLENRYVVFHDTSHTTHLLSAYVADDVTLVPDRVRLTLAGRLEHNSYTGFELQPTARLLWTPTPEQSFWAAASRGVRSPSRVEEGVRLGMAVFPPGTPRNPSGLPALAAMTSTRGQFQSEVVNAVELGMRRQLSASASVDVAAYANRYRRLRDFPAGAPVLELTPLPPHLFIPLNLGNGLAASAHGIEATLDWRPAAWLRLQPTYTYMRIDPADTTPGSPGAALAGNHPRHQWSVRASITPDERHQFDLWLRHVDTLASVPAPAYTTLDLRYAWKPRRNVELAIVGQNLLDPRHTEYTSDFIGSATSEVRRGVYLKGKVEF